jgi:hypothetical protein
MAKRYLVLATVLSSCVTLGACGIPTDSSPQIIPTPTTHPSHSAGSSLSILGSHRTELR